MNNNDGGLSTVTCIFISGQTVRYSDKLFLNWLRNVFYWALMFSIAIFMAFFEPSIVTNTSLSPNASFAYWVFIVVTYQVLIFASLFIIRVLNKVFRLEKVYLPVLSAPIVLVLMYVGQVYIALFEHQKIEFRHPPLAHFFVYYILEQSFQFIFINFVFSHLPKNEPTAKKELGKCITPNNLRLVHKANGRKVRVGDREYRLNAIHYFEASEHYIRIVHSGGEDFIRARMSQTLSGVSDDDGIQTHRSFWVSSAHIASARKESGKIIIQSTEHQDFTVARSRKKAVEKWLRDHGIRVE
ncbi:MAG: LytTR family DNA-binding domain-containing protein [Pseudomonadota bacterium]